MKVVLHEMEYLKMDVNERMALSEQGKNEESNQAIKRFVENDKTNVKWELYPVN